LKFLKLPLLDRDGFNLGTSSDETILSDQVGYGLWGFYSSASRDSGLIQGNDREMTVAGTSIARLIESKLHKSKLINLIDCSHVKRSEVEELRKEFLQAINDSEVASQLVSSLMRANSDKESKHSLQFELWNKTRELVKREGVESLNVKNLEIYFNRLRELNLSEELNQKLVDIENIERVLVALNLIFHYCRVCDGKDINELEQNLLTQNYQLNHLPTDLPSLDFHHKEAILKSLQFLNNQDYKSVIYEVADINKKVMDERQGAPWFEIDRNGKIKVRMKLEKFQLYKQEDLMGHWDYDYFLGSFLSISKNYLSSVYG